MDIHNIARVPAFTTKDGSEIRELLAHRNSCIRQQSLAEARLPPGTSTTPHYHAVTEEIYYILEGCGWMTIGDESQAVGPGDAVAIPRARSTPFSTRETGSSDSSAAAHLDTSITTQCLLPFLWQPKQLEQPRKRPIQNGQIWNQSGNTKLMSVIARNLGWFSWKVKNLSNAPVRPLACAAYECRWSV